MRAVARLRVLCVDVDATGEVFRINWQGDLTLDLDVERHIYLHIVLARVELCYLIWVTGQRTTGGDIALGYFGTESQFVKHN